MKINLMGLLAAGAVLASVGALSGPALAATPLISIDENGHGLLSFPGSPSIHMVGVLSADPGPGGLASVMTYDMLGPPSVTDGDVLFSDDGLILDVVRFNNYGTGGAPGYKASILFYSDNIDGFDAAADTSGPPTSLYTNSLTLNEVGGFAFYHPSAGQPGFVPGFDVAYNLFSDGTFGVPEPATWSMMIMGFGLAGAALRARRRPAVATA